MDNDEIFYSLSIEDIQNVASEEIGRTLSKKEIDIIKEYVAENISWYDAINEAINKYFSEVKK